MEKLQELCLDKIAASFEIYYHAYSKSPNEALKKGILFLQKVYSDKLILRLYKKGLMQEKYVHLVFTKYLKALNTEWLANCSWRTIVETFARIGPTLQEVCFGRRHVYSSHWDCVLPDLPNVKEVIYKKFCDDDFLEGLAQYCPRLEKLNVEGSCISDVGLGYICGMRRGKKRSITGNDKYSDPENKGNVPCPLLKEIVLESTAVGKEGVKRLIKEVPSLEKIACPFLPYVLHEIHEEDSGSSHEAVACKITHLDMARMSIPFGLPARHHEIYKSCISMCPNLTSVSCHIESSEDLNLYYKLVFLRKFEVHCSKLDVVASTFLRLMGRQVRSSLVVVNDFLRQMGAQLTDLSLHGCSVSFSVLRQCCPQLEYLALRSLSIEDDDHEVDSNLMFPYLETFRFEDIDFDNPDNSRAISRILTSSPKLENLNIRISMLYSSKACITAEVESAICKRCEMSAFKSILLQKRAEEEFLRRIFSVCSPMKRVYLDGFSAVHHVREIAATVPNRPKILVSEVPCYQFPNGFVDL